MRTFARIAVLALTLTALGACGSDRSTAPVSVVNGKWTGTATFQGIDFDVAADLKHAAGDTIVSGTGSVGVGANLIPFTVAGVFKAPDVTLAFTNPQYEPMNYTAAVSGTTMSGVLDGSGLDSVTVTLTRQ